MSDLALLGLPISSTNRKRSKSSPVMIHSAIPLNKIIFQVYHSYLGSTKSREYSPVSLCQEDTDDEIEDEESLKPQALKFKRLMNLLDEDGVRLDKKEVLWSVRTDGELDPLEKDRHFRDAVRRHRPSHFT